MDDSDEKSRQIGFVSQEQRTTLNRELDDARREIDAAVAMTGNESPELREARRQVEGAQQGVEVTPEQLAQARRAADEARDKAREEEGKKIAEKSGEFLLSVAAITAVVEAGRGLLRSGLSLSGGNLAAGALNTPEIDSNMNRAGAPAAPATETKEITL